MKQTNSKKKDTAYYTKRLWFLFAGFIGFLILFFALLSIGWLGFMPSFKELENPQSLLASEIISADQKVLGTYYIQNRSNCEFDEISPNLVNALIATEDIRFYSHSGIDFLSLARVIGKTIIGGDRSSGGGSTITQQLAKNLFPRERKNIISIGFRKLKEWVIAIKLERNYSKEEIIAMYLNTVDFGNNSFGIKVATNTYFKKTPAELSVDEAAILVGMLKATSYYSPIKNPENSKNRRNTVLNQMRKAEYISDEEFETYSKLPIDMSKFTQQNHQFGLATYFREYLRKYMEAWCKTHKKADGTNYNLYKDGLKIYTTINSRMQEYAEQAVNEWIGKEIQPAFYANLKNSPNAPFIDISKKDIEKILTQAMKNSARYKSLKENGASSKEIEEAFHTPVEMTVFSWQGDIDTVMSPWDSLRYYKWFLHCGLMSVEPQTGYIRAYVGGINYKYFQFDNVMQGTRQVGSTFKPFVYTLAMQEGEFSPCTEVPNSPICIEQAGQPDWCPKNSTKAKEGEMVTLRWALANSVNYISAYLIKRFPPQAVVNLARKMGITSPLDPVPSICLGSVDVSVAEMTSAMSTYANKGIHISPIFITRIEDKNGLVLEEFIPQQNEAMNEKTAYMMIQLMKGVVESGTAGRLRYKYGLSETIAGKTGTTQNNSDGWFMGLTPQLVTGVWVGGELRSIHFRSTALGQGANTALPIWGLYMKKVFSDPVLNLYNGDFEKPSTLTDDHSNCTQYNQNNQNNNNSLFDDEM